jgi:hypothetical protein
MPYNRKNYLLKVKAVCELYQLRKQEDVPASATFRRYVLPMYPMDINTFYKMIGINYKKELAEFNKEK